MAWFLFIGDMLVMLFMTVLIVWISLRGQRRALDYSAGIPLQDERSQPELNAAPQSGDQYG